MTGFIRRVIKKNVNCQPLLDVGASHHLINNNEMSVAVLKPYPTKTLKHLMSVQQLRTLKA